jgi:hypothetical protein
MSCMLSWWLSRGLAVDRLTFIRTCGLFLQCSEGLEYQGSVKNQEQHLSKVWFHIMVHFHM